MKAHPSWALGLQSSSTCSLLTADNLAFRNMPKSLDPGEYWTNARRQRSEYTPTYTQGQEENDSLSFEVLLSRKLIFYKRAVLKCLNSLLPLSKSNDANFGLRFAKSKIIDPKRAKFYKRS